MAPLLQIGHKNELAFLCIRLPRQDSSSRTRFALYNRDLEARGLGDYACRLVTLALRDLVGLPQAESFS